MRPEVRGLECFVAVAEELHFRRASERVGMSQPALSQRIRNLEQNLGVRLFSRDRRSVGRTPAGEAFLAEVRAALASIDRAVDVTRRQGNIAQHKLRLGHLDYITLPWFASLIHRLMSGDEPIDVQRVELNPNEVERALLERIIDVGLIVRPVTADDLVMRMLYSGRWCIMLPEDHALADKEELDLIDLDGHPLVMFARTLNPALFDRLRGLMRDAGFEPNIVYETSQAASGPGLVRNDVGLFIVASYILAEIPAGLVTRPLRGFPELDLGFAWHVDNTSSAVRLFREALDTEATSNPSLRREMGAR